MSSPALARAALLAAAVAAGGCGGAEPAAESPGQPTTPAPAPVPAPRVAEARPGDAPSAAPATSATAAAKAPEPAPPATELAPGQVAAAAGPPPSITIAAPAKNQVIPSAKAAGFEVKLRAQGFDLAAGGDHLCVRVDKHPCRAVTDLKKPLTLKEIDPTLDDGQHVLTVLARRGSGEWVKPAGKRAAFASHSFYVGKKVAPLWKDGGPMVFFDPPADGPAPPEGVLIDYYVANAEVARGKHVVHVSVGGPGLGVGTAVVADSLAPWRLKNARPGEYIVRLTLHGYAAELGESSSSTTVSFASRPVPGAFSEVTRSFKVTAR